MFYRVLCRAPAQRPRLFLPSANLQLRQCTYYLHRLNTDCSNALEELQWIGRVADGFNRRFGQGKGKVLINGEFAPVMGNVCMDMTMVDITGISAEEGDEVTIFGPDLPIQQVAKWIDTIPYELLTSTSERVKRVFFAESI